MYDRILGCQNDSDCPTEEHCEDSECVCGKGPGKQCDFQNGEICKSEKCVKGDLIKTFLLTFNTVNKLITCINI